MKKMILLSVLLIIGTVNISIGTVLAKKQKVLIFSKTLGFHHNSIKQGIAAIQKLGVENKFEVDSTTNSSNFNTENLKQYAAVIFLSTTGDVLNNEQQAAFEKYIQAGGGFAGIHSATDCEYNWPWYGKLAGAYFAGHPNQQDAVLNVTNRNHISTKALPGQWKRKDEWYNFRAVYDKITVLISIDENSYDAGKNKMGDHHPIAWYHHYDGGRAFYTGLGHTEESFSEPLFLQHLLGGIKYAMGRKK
jgi:type 1 glutamine amidotransferase